MSSSSTEKKEIRKFGAIALLLFGALFLIAFWRHRSTALWIFGSLAGLGAGFILIPDLLRPVHSAWMKAAHAVGKITTAAMLTFAYYLVVTPSAWIKRFFGGTPLPLRPDKNATSYWVARKEPAQPRERFIKRY